MDDAERVEMLVAGLAARGHRADRHQLGDGDHLRGPPRAGGAPLAPRIKAHPLDVAAAGAAAIRADPQRRLGRSPTSIDQPCDVTHTSIKSFLLACNASSREKLFETQGPVSMDSVATGFASPIYRTLAIALLAASAYSTDAHANDDPFIGTSLAQPTWYTTLAPTEIEFPLTAPILGIRTARFDDGRLVVMQRAESINPQPNFLGYLVIDAGASTRVGQVGHGGNDLNFAGAGPLGLGPEGQMLAWVAQGSRAVAAYDGDGVWRWGHWSDADRAIWDPSGRWIITTSGSASALDAQTGRLLWATSIHEAIGGPATFGIEEVTLASGLLIALAETSRHSGQQWLAMAMRTSDGAAQWTQNLPLSTWGDACLAASDELRIYRPISSANGSDRLDVERRNLATGELIATVSHPIGMGEGCRVSRLAALDVVSIGNSSDGETIAFAADGTIAWRFGVAGRVAPILDSTGFMLTRTLPGAQVSIQRRRLSDGAPQWSRIVDEIEIDGDALALSVTGVQLVGTWNGQLKTAAFTPDGAQLAVPALVFKQIQRNGFGYLVVEQSVYTVEGVGLGAASRLRLARRAAATGAVLAEVEINPSLAGTGSVTADLYQLPAGILVFSHGGGASVGGCPVRTLFLTALNPQTLSEQWRRSVTIAPSPLRVQTLPDGRIALAFNAFDSTTCASIPTVQMLSGVDGSEQFTIPMTARGFFSTTSGLVVYGPDSAGQNRFVGLSSAGAVRWQQSFAPAQFSQFLVPEAVGDGFVVAQSWPNPSLLPLRRLSGADGSQSWLRELGTSSDPIALTANSVLENASTLVTGAGRINRGPSLSTFAPAVVVQNGLTGDLLYEFRPPHLGSLYWVLRPMQTHRDGEYWFRSMRSDLPFISFPTLTSSDHVASLQRLTAAGWLWSPDYVLHRREGELFSPRSTMPPITTAADDGVLALLTAPRGARTPARVLMRLPPPLDSATDLRIRPIDEPMPLLGLGARRSFSLEIENAGAVSVQGARIRAVRSADSPELSLAGCRAIAGAGSCSAGALGQPDGFTLSLEAGAAIELTYEAFSHEFRRANSSGWTRVRIAVDTPYPVAESNLADNVIEVTLRLSDFADSFED